MVSPLKGDTVICGHAGIIGPGILWQDLKVLDDLARCSVVRGKDGAGVLQGRTNYQKLNYRVSKTGHEIGDLIYREKQKDGDKWLLNDVQDNFFCVHVRAATIGTVSQRNSHPFDFENLVGMHNGTLKPIDYFSKDDSTDSELMFKDMNSKSIEEVLKKLHIDSAYAVVVFDKTRNQLVFAKNQHRPLCFCINKDRGVMYYASESGMLSWILSRNDIKHDKILIFNNDMSYRIDPRFIRANKFPEFEREDLTSPAPLFNLQDKPPPWKEKDQKVLLFEPPTRSIRDAALEAREKATKKDTTPAKQSAPRRTEVKSRSSFLSNCISCNRILEPMDKLRADKLKGDSNQTFYVCEFCDWDIDMKSFAHANLKMLLN